MKKFDFKNPYIKALLVILPIFLLLILAGIRLDLTQEKRYTLSDATIETLKSVKEPLTVEVYLEGDFPANFKQLQNETQFLLEEFRKINPKIDYKFIDPIATKMSQDTLQAMGIKNSALQVNKEGKISQIQFFPYAKINYKGYEKSIPLIITDKEIDIDEIIKKSIENLEYNFTNEFKSIISITKTLESIKEPMNIEVLLEGNLPEKMQMLNYSTRFMLNNFKKVNPNINFKFIDPIATNMSQETLQAMGTTPLVFPYFHEGKIYETLIFPYAIIKYHNMGTSIPLIENQNLIETNEYLENTIKKNELKLISTIGSLTREKRKNVGVLINQDELRVDEFRSFMDMTLENYNAGPVIPENKKELSFADIPKLKMMDALVIAKPRKAFTETEKVILDQYIMNGGKTLWMIDADNAEMDTLMIQKKLMAYPIDINMTDFFFNYGIRINTPLIKDFQKSALIRLQTGEVAGNPQYTNLIWPYFPLGINENKNPITRNINPVKFEFPTAIDTLGRKNIRTQVLYESSARTTSKTVPNYVELSELANLDSLSVMEKPTTPKIFAVSLEGKFTSAYAMRSEKNGFPNFKNGVSSDNKMIVIADGDVGRNQLMKGQPLPLGADLLTNQQYGNEQFLRNCLDWLLDDSNLIELRNRNIEARLLDRRRIDEEKTNWQWFNLLTPLVIIGLLGGIFFWLRKKKFG